MKFNKVLENIKNYETGKPIELLVREFGIQEENVIKLASNENPMGTSKKVQKIIRKSANKAHLYPDDSMIELKVLLAKKYKVKTDNIIIGSGSDQVIELAIHAKVDGSSAILTSGITFAMYEIYAKHVGAKVYKTNSAKHNLNEFKELYFKHKEEIKIIFLCIPNNPLGECLDEKYVKEFIEEIDKDTLIVIDGAYNEFAKFKDEKKAIHPRDLIDKHRNILYLGTFSKLYGLGGMRIGYGIADKEIIDNLLKLRAPFNVTNISLKAAKEVLKDKKYAKKTLKNNFKEMKRYEKFAKKNNIEIIDSYTNFITYIFKDKSSTEIYDTLLKKGIILRDLKSYGINAIRITIGLPSQNKLVLKELKNILRSVDKI